jgi:hypothetical protein
MRRTERAIHMNTNQARAYEEIETATADWLNKDREGEKTRPETSTPDAWSEERDETGGVIRLRLNLRDRQAPGAEAADETKRKRPRRATQPEKDQTPPPRPRIVWRREDENETRPPPAIIME